MWESWDRDLELEDTITEKIQNCNGNTIPYQPNNNHNTIQTYDDNLRARSKQFDDLFIIIIHGGGSNIS